jgi:hypothetical protein
MGGEQWCDMPKRKTARRNRPRIEPEDARRSVAGTPEAFRSHAEALNAISFGDAVGLARYLREQAEAAADFKKGIHPEVVKTIAFLLDPTPVQKPAIGWVIHTGGLPSQPEVWAQGWRLEFKPKRKINKYAREQERKQIGFHVFKLRNEGKVQKIAVDETAKKFGIVSRRKVDEAYAFVKNILSARGIYPPRKGGKARSANYPSRSRRKGSE